MLPVSSLLNPSLQSGRTRNRSTYKRYGAHHWRVCVTFHVVVWFFQRKNWCRRPVFSSWQRWDWCSFSPQVPVGVFFNGGTDSGCLYTQTCFFFEFLVNKNHWNWDCFKQQKKITFDVCFVPCRISSYTATAICEEKAPSMMKATVELFRIITSTIGKKTRNIQHFDGTPAPLAIQTPPPW